MALSLITENTYKFVIDFSPLVNRDVFHLKITTQVQWLRANRKDLSNVNHFNYIVADSLIMALFK